MTRKQTKLRKKRQAELSTKPSDLKAPSDLKEAMRSSLRGIFPNEASYAAAMDSITQEMSECVIDVVKEQEETAHQRMDGSCHIPGIGTFHLYRYRDSDYHLMLEHSVYKTNPILKCGRRIQRFIHTDPCTLVVQFYDYDQLVIITTKDKWKTVQEERQPTPLISQSE